MNALPAQFNFLVLMFSLMALTTFAQGVDMEADIEARMETVLVLNIDPESRIDFGIKEVNENLYQITKSPVDVSFSVEATSNWKLSISSDKPYFRGMNDTSQKIPVDFLGYYIENLGKNWDNGLFSNIANSTKDTLIALKAQERLLLVNGDKGNIGGAEDNNFVLRWKFLFESDTAKFIRLQDLDVKDDYYTGRFYLTLSESQARGSSK